MVAVTQVGVDATLVPVAIKLQVRELREARGWSQAELARQSGVPQPTISRMEAAGRSEVHHGALERLAAALEVEPGALLVRVPAERPRRGRKLK